jgi:hypothetical protein
MIVEVREADVQLAEVAEDALNYLTPDEGSTPTITNPDRAVQMYDTLVHWKLSLPDQLRFEEAVLPSTILLR